jgi:uncharacterized protein with ParB-like and HNH nuclease domain
MREGTLIPNPEFQRRLVWTNKDKQNFLLTVLEEYPFPEIYVAAGEVNLETGEGTEMLVDGQQRLATLRQYFNASPELKLSSDLVPYSELSEASQRGFLEYEVVVRDLGSLNLEDMKVVFRRINSTRYALNAMEIANARFDGEFKQFGESIAEDAFFDAHRVFSANDIRRMEDTRFALGFITTVMSTYFHRDSELEDYLKTYNDEFDIEPDLRKEMRRVMEFVESCNFKPISRVWKRADLFTLLVEIYRAIENQKMVLDPVEISKRLNKFYAKVDNIQPTQTPSDDVGQYYKAALQATNDRGSRITRGKVVANLISLEAGTN